MKTFIYTLLFLSLLLTQNVSAETESLKGLKTAKFVVDLNQGSAQLLLLRLRLIEQTITDISKNGVKPEIVVAVRGQASRFMTVTDVYLADEDKIYKDDIYAALQKLRSMGARLEQCSIALNLLKIDSRGMYPEINLVPNGYVSLIGYQNRGYAILPME